MKGIFEPAIRVLMHWRNKVKMPLAGGVFCVPLAIAVFLRPTELMSPSGIALAVTFVLAWYYIGAMFYTSDESWAQVHQVARRLADRDLRQTTRDEEVAAVRKRLGSGQFGQLFNALTETHQSLRQIVAQARSSAQAAHAAADELARGSVRLTQRSESQAATLEQTASGMEEVATTVKRNADHCRRASELSSGSAEIALRGADLMQRAVATMERIDGSSKRIVDIIAVIEGIAFQTNILALNAAVEAARAGEQGRGFAVVAAEVRSLAQRSAGAAREIKALIGESVGNVGEGATLVQEAGRTMDEIATSVAEVDKLIREIAVASREQSTGVDEMNAAITSLQGVTQENAAMVQAAAHSAVLLKEESGRLFELVGRFRVDEAPVAHPAPAAQAAPLPGAGRTAVPRLRATR